MQSLLYQNFLKRLEYLQLLDTEKAKQILLRTYGLTYVFLVAVHIHFFHKLTLYPLYKVSNIQPNSSHPLSISSSSYLLYNSCYLMPIVQLYNGR